MNRRRVAVAALVATTLLSGLVAPSATANDNCPPADKRCSNAQPDTRPKPAQETPAERRKRAAAEAAAREAAALRAAAEAALAAAERSLASLTPEYERATSAVAGLVARDSAAKRRMGQAREVLGRTARAAYMQGIDPEALTQVATLSADSANEFTQMHVAAGMIGGRENNRIVAALRTIDRLKGRRAAAERALAAVKPRYDLAQLNVAAARAALGLGPPLTADSTIYRDYPIPDCQFDTTTNTTRSCQDAMRFAIEQVANPMKDWFYLCLNLVTIAYGAPQTIPRAIDMWNGLPADARHSPSSPAPPGALMFWAPNHVAISLGNNMLVSVDVLGKGRVWIVSLETIQARWNMPYLGWTQPDFRNA